MTQFSLIIVYVIVNTSIIYPSLRVNLILTLPNYISSAPHMIIRPRLGFFWKYNVAFPPSSAKLSIIRSALTLCSIKAFIALCLDTGTYCYHMYPLQYIFTAVTWLSEFPYGNRVHHSRMEWVKESFYNVP